MRYPDSQFVLSRLEMNIGRARSLKASQMIWFTNLMTLASWSLSVISLSSAYQEFQGAHPRPSRREFRHRQPVIIF